MRAAPLTGCIAAGAIVLAAASTGAAKTGPEIGVDVRVTTVSPDSGARVEFTPERGSFVALYGVFSDGSLRALFPEVEGVNTWVEARETRVVRVPLPEGLRLESVQAVASVRWFDPACLGIAAARPDRPTGPDGDKEWTTGREAARDTDRWTGSGAGPAAPGRASFNAGRVTGEPAGWLGSWESSLGILGACRITSSEGVARSASWRQPNC